MDFKTISDKIYLSCTYDVYLAFYETFRGCIISKDNVQGFCKAFNITLNL